MKFRIYLALKYLSKRGSYLLTTSNLIAFLGIVIGLFSLIVVSSVMNGLSADMARRIVSAKGEIRLYTKDFSPFTSYEALADSLLQIYPQVVRVGAVNHGEYLVKRKNNTGYTECYGVDFANHQDISNIFSQIKIGFPTEASFINNGIILGSELAWQIMATVGDTVEVVSPLVMIPTPLGMIPKTDRFRVVGIFRSGLPEFDRLYSFIDIERSKDFRRHRGVDYLELKTDIKSLNFRPLVTQIENDFPHLHAEHWEIFDRTLFSAIKVEKMAMFVVMAIILVLASFNITGNFIRTVTEKREEIALLQTIGMTKQGIFSFFILMGTMIGTAGIIIADILALLILFLQKSYELIQIPVQGFPFSAVPVDISLSRVIWFSLLSFAICVLGTIYPAYKTMKITIIEVLNEELGVRN